MYIAYSLFSEISSSSPNANPLHHPDYFDVHKLVNLKEMFNARVHLGHHEGCWNPLMKPYIIGTREHYHIIDLNETARHIKVSLISCWLNIGIFELVINWMLNWCFNTNNFILINL